MIVSIYVDDLIFTSNDKVMFDEFKSSMQHEFDMSDSERMKFFLGMEVIQNDEGIYIHQKKYAQEIPQKFRMENSNATKTLMVSGFKLIKDEKGARVDST